MAEPDAENAEKKHVHGLSYVLFYCVLFFANWFGSDQFDMDGDGDFDPEDVQAYLADKGFISKKGVKPKRKSRAPSRSQQAVTQERQDEAEDGGAAVEDAGADGNDPAAGGASASGMPTKKSNSSFFDRDGDGDVDLNDMLESSVDAEMAQEDTVMKEIQRGRFIPWFIVFECLAVLSLWLAFAVKTSSEMGGDLTNQKGGFDNLAEGMTDLRLFGPACEDDRAQAWRWWTYQFTHVGASHVLMNCFLTVMLGAPLEVLHGHLRLTLMFNIGVFGGSCMHFVNDAHTVVVGCSGGCYALIGIHLGDLIMNWSQKKFRIPTLVLLAMLVGIDVGSVLLSLSSEQSSHSAHIGGAVAGLIIGCIVCKNIRSVWYEKYIVAFFSLLGIALTGLCMAWLFTRDGGPLNIWEYQAGETGWCWWQQVWNFEIDEHSWECVRCGTVECVNKVKEQKHLKSVSLEDCEISGYLDISTLFATDPRQR